MKNQRIILLSLIFISACIFDTRVRLVAVPPSQTCDLGDVNGDNDVNIVDGLLIAQYYVGMNPQNFNQAKADINSDAKIDIVDALVVAQVYVGTKTLTCVTATPVTLAPVTVFIAGDSTVQTYTNSAIHQAGWGQMLGEYFTSKATIDNRAIGGRTARRFIDEGYLTEILGTIKAGDYFLVQFGTNDGNKTATYTFNGQTIPYYLDPQTDFKTYLKQYIDGARARNANPVLVTPPPRNSAYCTGGNGTGAHAQAMRELGISMNVPVVDLNQMSVDYLKAICPSPQPENFFLLRADGTVDGTHFQENGARILAGFIASSVRSLGITLASYLK
jgi:lysophospholipase L1-like esterase